MEQRSGYYIGYDIGGTKCAVTLGRYSDASDSFTVEDKVRFDTNPGGDIRDPYDVLSELARGAEKLLSEHNAAPLRMGISCGGPLDSSRGVIMSPPNLPGWDNVNAVKYFTDIFGVQCVLQNDANACAVAEWRFGAGRGTRNMVFFTFGTGLGAGLIIDGKLYSGTSDMAGEAGHVRCSGFGPVGYGKAGSYEGFCSGAGIAKIGKMLGLPGDMTARDIAERARAGDAVCREVYRVSGEKLGYLLSIIIDILNPEAVVIGGVFARSSDLLLPHAESIIEKETLEYARKVCRILPAGLGELTGDYSALSLAVFA